MKALLYCPWLDTCHPPLAGCSMHRHLHLEPRGQCLPFQVSDFNLSKALEGTTQSSSLAAMNPVSGTGCCGLDNSGGARPCYMCACAGALPCPAARPPGLAPFYFLLRAAQLPHAFHSVIRRSAGSLRR